MIKGLLDCMPMGAKKVTMIPAQAVQALADGGAPCAAMHAVAGWCGRREVTESVGGAVTGNAASSPPLVAESSESNADAFKEAYTVDESKWEMPADLKAKYA